MKRYCARIGLLIGSMLMALAGNLIALGAAVIGSNRAWPVAVANDQALNAALVGRTGSEDETVEQSGRQGGAQGEDLGVHALPPAGQDRPWPLRGEHQHDEGERTLE